MPKQPSSRSSGKVRGKQLRADSVLTIDELSAYLKLAKSTTYKLAQEGKIPGQKVGRHWRFHKEAIDQWLSDRRPGGTQR